MNFVGFRIYKAPAAGGQAATRLTTKGYDSPCIDAGTDLAAAFDIGAYECDGLAHDTDGDGMPDGWEYRYGLNPTNAADAALHGDADGVSNRAEYVADTDPTNAAAYFHVVAFSNQPPTNLVFFLSSTNRVYTLQWRTNLLTGVWSNAPAQTDVRGVDGMSTLRETNRASPRFYRVGVELP